MARPGSAKTSSVPPLDMRHMTITRLPAKTTLHRIHQDIYDAAQFNPSTKGNTRFSPITTSAGTPIPTLYAGESFDCAAMETIFHDIPYAPGLKTIEKSKLKQQVHSELMTTVELALVDLRTMALRKLGVERKAIIDTEKDQYPHTRFVAAQIHSQRADAQGLLWTSRQDDSAKAVMLFGDRISDGVLEQVGVSHDLIKTQATYEDVLKLASRIGVDIVPGI